MFESAKVRKEIERRKIAQKADEAMAKDAAKKAKRDAAVQDFKEKQLENKRINDLRSERYKNASKEERKNIKFSERPRSHKILAFVAVVFVIWAVAKFFEREPTQAEIAQLSIDRENKIKKENETKIEEAKQELETAAKNARLYALSFGETAIKESLRDPDSIQWKWKAVNLDNGALCYLYRAKNGFGGYTEDGTVIHKGKAYSSTAQWNKLCGKNASYEEY